VSIDVRLSGGYRLRDLDRLLGTLHPLLGLKEPRVVTIDLSGLVFLSPANLAVLTAALSKLIEEELWEQGTRLIAPRSWPVARYLQRMDVIRHFAGEVEEDFERRPPVGFRACQRFTGEDSHVASRELTDAVAERVPADSLGRGSLYVCLDELAENVVHHAQSRVGGFAVAQGWEKRGEVEIAIVDLGIGIRASLRKNPEYADIRGDVEAIQKATSRT
jgi:hypothetical protein